MKLMLLEDFLYYLQHEPLRLPNGNIIPEKKLSNRSLQFYVSTVRSYFDYNDIVMIPSKFKRRVKVPKLLRYPEQPLDVKDIRDILLACSSKRLKAYLLVLATGGMRAVEACAIALKDIKFDSSPTSVHIRPEFAKTRVGRDIYISDEATKYFKEWIDYRYRDRQRKDAPTFTKDDNDMVFQQVNTKDVSPRNIYRPVGQEFTHILKTLKMDDRKEGMLRRKITLHSLRRFVYTTMCNQQIQDMQSISWGHSGSPYRTMKKLKRRNWNLNFHVNIWAST